MADRLSRRLETGDDAEVGDADAMSLLIIVRRGQTERFERVTRTLGRTAEVIWDRRVAERRRPDTLAAVDRRRRERRHLHEEEFVLGLVEDRRAALRRERMEPRSPERRRGERRGPLPVSWTALDCVVIHVSDPR
jgi:hypothetical protein